MSINNEWLDTYYAEVGREIDVASSQLHDTTNWSIGIAMAAVSTLAISERPYPDVWTFGVVVVGFVLVMRFFIRSCLAYANLDKWSKIHRLITKYRLQTGSADTDSLGRDIEEAIQQYHIEWRSPKPPWALLWSNLKLGYLYLFLVLSCLLVAGVIVGCCEPVVWVMTAAWIACVIYEVVIFPRRTYFKAGTLDLSARARGKG